MSNDSFDSTNGVAIFNSTNALPTAPASPAGGPLVSGKIVASLAIFIFSIGICANSVVLTVMLRARRHFGSATHTLITNLSAIDLWTCVFGTSTMVMMITHGYRYGGNRIIDGAKFLIVDGR